MTFAKGQPKPPNGGRRKGTPNRGTVRAHRLVSEASDKVIVDKVVQDAESGDHAARQIYFRFLRPPQPKSASFTPQPFELRKPTTMEEAGAETLRIADAVALGQLDHDSGQFLIAALKTFVETLAGVKIEKEIAAADALKAEDGP
ncbi:MAG TPA: hypothetical protein VFE60_13930 [Roseiarcus sp.]|jgi:hypothetical protein|nr:hypothetical protein [Roseiarcus sp.]